jgi:UDP-glucose 4-epimerase
LRIFIAGGAGFIGSHLADRFLACDDVKSVVIYDNFSSGTQAHIARYLKSPKLSVIDGDLKHLGLLTHAMEGTDLVVHVAANPDISRAVRQPDIDFWEGTYLTQNILESMRINEVGSILYTSGSGVYGEVPDQAFSESYGPCFPISTYGASKLSCEALISAYCHMFSMKGRAFRFANVVGPLQTHGVGYDFIRRLKADPTSLRILGDGTQSKSYIHVDDVVHAMLLVRESINKSGAAFDVFNVATDDYISVTEIADIACEAACLAPSKVRYEYTGGDRGWKGDVPKVLFNVEKIKALGWKAGRNSRQAIKDSIDAMRIEIQEK